MKSKKKPWKTTKVSGKGKEDEKYWQYIKKRRRQGLEIPLSNTIWRRKYVICKISHSVKKKQEYLIPLSDSAVETKNGNVNLHSKTVRIGWHKIVKTFSIIMADHQRFFTFTFLIERKENIHFSEDIKVEAQIVIALPCIFMFSTYQKTESQFQIYCIAFKLYYRLTKWIRNYISQNY